MGHKQPVSIISGEWLVSAKSRRSRSHVSFRTVLGIGMVTQHFADGNLMRFCTLGYHCSC
jgi:hypothetical protein